MNKKISILALFIILSSFVSALPANQLEDIDNQIITIENLIRNAKNPIEVSSPVTSVLTNPWVIGLVVLVILHFVAMKKVRPYRTGVRSIRRWAGLRSLPFSDKAYSKIHTLIGEKVKLMKEIEELFQKHWKSGFSKGNLATIYTEDNKEYFSKPFSEKLHRVLNINRKLRKVELKKLVFDYSDLKEFFGDNKFKNAINWNDRYLTTMKDSEIEELWNSFMQKEYNIKAHKKQDSLKANLNSKLAKMIEEIENNRTDLKSSIVKRLNDQDFEALMLTVALAKEVHELVNQLIEVIQDEDRSVEGLYDLLYDLMHRPHKATPERIRKYFGMGAGGRLVGQTQGSTSILQFFKLYEEKEKPILRRIFADRLVTQKVNELFDILEKDLEEDLAASSEEDETTPIMRTPNYRSNDKKKDDDDNIIDAKWRFVDEDEEPAKKDGSKLQLEDKQKRHPKSKPNSGMSTLN